MNNPSLTPDEMEQFRNGVSMDEMLQMKFFSTKENEFVSFVPLVVAEMAWHYAMKVLDYCAKYKIRDTKELTRAIRMLREHYRWMLSDTLDLEHRRKLFDETEKLMNNISSDMQILWFTVSNEIKLRYPDIEYEDMRVDAMISIMLLKYYRNHNAKMDKKINRLQKLDIKWQENPYISALYLSMDAYFGKTPISYNEHMECWEKIFIKNIVNTDFKVLELKSDEH